MSASVDLAEIAGGAATCPSTLEKLAGLCYNRASLQGYAPWANICVLGERFFKMKRGASTRLLATTFVGLLLLLAALPAASAQGADIPQVDIGDRAIVGSNAMRSESGGPIGQYMAQGGQVLPALAASGPAAAETDTPVVRFILFYGESCPHCHDVMDEYLPGVYEKYGDQVEYQYLEVWSNTDDYLTMLGLETKLGIPDDRQGAVPALVIGDKVLIGGFEIPDKLETYIDEYLAEGGVDYPDLEDLPEVVLPTPEPSVQILVIYDPNYADFERVNTLMVSLGQKYAAGLQAYAVDVTQEGSDDVVTQLHTALGVKLPEPGTPEVMIGRQMLVGIDEIESELPGLVEKHLAEGGLELPTLEELAAEELAGDATPSPAGTEPPGITDLPAPGEKPIHLLYFYKTGCQDCDRAKYDLNFIQQTYPQVEVTERNIEENQALAEWMGERLGVPEEERLESPAIFIGEDHLVGDDMTLRAIQAAVEKHVPTGAEPAWEAFGAGEQEQAEESLIERYASLGALTVIGAGLINGLNPCAFVTIVFFLSYLAFMGRSGREVLVVGAMFTLGVFVTYLLAGLGLTSLLEPLAGVQVALKRWVFGFTAILCLALAGISLHDYIKARQGKTDEMKLKLSLDLRRRVNKVIRKGSKMRGFYLVAFGVGALVSLIQLTCTSPIYIGIVFLIQDVPEMRSNGFLYLLLYNLAYIVPLVIVFLLAYFGTSSEKMGEFITKRTAAIKLLTVVVFLVLAGWLLYSLAPLFGVT